jgi:hypothetical protein
MNLMMGAQLPQQLVPEHPVAAENQDSHRKASEGTAATTVFLEIRRMPIEFLPYGRRGLRHCRLPPSS